MTDSGPRELFLSDLDLSAFIERGDGVAWGQACAEPLVLVDALLEQASELEDVSAFVGLSWRDLSDSVPAGMRIVSYGGLGRLGRLPDLEVVPCHFSALPALFAEHKLPGDVVLVQVAPPDEHGRCSLGVGADYILDATKHARVVIAEVNEQCPRTAGDGVAWDRLNAYVHTDRALLEAPVPTPGELEGRIAEHVASIVEDGDTIQLGVGALPEAILRALKAHRDLGVHSGMISDGVLELIEVGVVSNARKPVDRGVSVTGAALGSHRLFSGLDGREDVRFAPVSYTHHSATLARIGPLATINSALEVDLTGQVSSEAAGGRRLGAVGGQVDFLRAASTNGGKPIIALPAVRIVGELSGPVTTARSDVDWVVTENGACSLRGLSEPQRKRALAHIAMSS
jgi:acyl-CoA hydrolase